ncbi:hypothetical protein M0805_002718, partial [Coniferiporia weirii]
SVESDIYALAMVMLEAFTGDLPFREQPREVGVVIDITLGVCPARPGAHATALGLSDAMWKLMEECWQTEYRKRLQLPEVLAHVKRERISLDWQVSYLLKPNN